MVAPCLVDGAQTTFTRLAAAHRSYLLPPPLLPLRLVDSGVWGQVVSEAVVQEGLATQGSAAGLPVLEEL